MIVPYTELPPATGGGPRPLLDLSIADVDDVRVPCLVDSGSLNTLLPSWLAATAGVSLRRLPRRSLGVGGTDTRAAFVVTRLSAANHVWEAEVGFCDPWPYAWGLERLTQEVPGPLDVAGAPAQEQHPGPLEAGAGQPGGGAEVLV